MKSVCKYSTSLLQTSALKKVVLNPTDMKCISQTVHLKHSSSCGFSCAALPPAWSLEGERLQGSGPPLAPHLEDGLSSFQKSHGHHESQGARKQNSHMTWGALPSCNKDTETKKKKEVWLAVGNRGVIDPPPPPPYPNTHLRVVVLRNPTWYC